MHNFIFRHKRVKMPNKNVFQHFENEVQETESGPHDCASHSVVVGETCPFSVKTVRCNQAPLVESNEVRRSRAAGIIQKQRWGAQRHRFRRVSDTSLGLVVDADLWKPTIRSFSFCFFSSSSLFALVLWYVGFCYNLGRLVVTVWGSHYSIAVLKSLLCLGFGFPC